MLSWNEYVAIYEVTKNIYNNNYIMFRGNTINKMSQVGISVSIGTTIVSIAEYKEHLLTYFPKSPNINYSYKFTGCAMGLFVRNGIEYVCHIALDGNDSFSGYNNQNWINVQQSGHFKNIFYPSMGRTSDVLYKVCEANENSHGATCIGIIINNNCYSIVYDTIKHNMVSIEQWVLYNPYNQDLYSPNGKKILQYSKQFKLL